MKLLSTRGRAALSAALLVLLSAASVFACAQLQSRQEPVAASRAMQLQAHWPGATAQQVADELSATLESRLQAVSGVEMTTSCIQPGSTRITVTLHHDVPAAAVPLVWHRVRAVVAQTRPTLPPGVTGPFIDDEMGAAPWPEAAAARG